jgi:hypothetical protein
MVPKPEADLFISRFRNEPLPKFFYIFSRLGNVRCAPVKCCLLPIASAFRARGFWISEVVVALRLTDPAFGRYIGGLIVSEVETEKA